MNDTLKKIIAGVATVTIGILAWYGSYLPLSKSLAFIQALGSAPRVHSWDDFKQTFSVPLDIPSPVGQEELVRNLGNTLIGIIGDNKNPQLAVEALGYIKQYYDPIVQAGRGINFDQNLYILGALNETALRQTRDSQYLREAEKYYEEGLALSPTRPQFLYSLLTLYQVDGKIDKAKKIAEQIVHQWPDDTKTKALLTTLEVASSTTNVLPKTNTH